MLTQKGGDSPVCQNGDPLLHESLPGYKVPLGKLLLDLFADGVGPAIVPFTPAAISKLLLDVSSDVGQRRSALGSSFLSFFSFGMTSRKRSSLEDRSVQVVIKGLSQLCERGLLEWRSFDQRLEGRDGLDTRHVAILSLTPLGRRELNSFGKAKN